MFVITKKLRQHMADNFKMADSASDDDARSLVTEKLMSGDLDASTLAELTKKDASESEQRLEGMISRIVEKSLAGFAAKGGDGASATDPVTAPAETKAHGMGGATDPAAVADPATAASPGTSKGMALMGQHGQNPAGTGQGGATDEVHIRMKAAVERYEDTKTGAYYSKSANEYNQKRFGNEALRLHGDAGRTLNMETDRQMAVAGAWFKHLMRKQLRSKGIAVKPHWQPSEHEQQLLAYTANECKFVGPIGYRSDSERHTRGWGDSDFEFDGEKAHNDLHVKTLLDDSTSGGLEAVPIEFDDLAILTPLLNGELFPLVNLINVSRRRIEAAVIGNPITSWGPNSGTAIGLFNTDSFISAFDNNVYPITGAMEIGLDFLADSPLNVGQLILRNYGQRFLQEMDNVIVTGDGSTQPEGIMNASGVATVTPGSGALAAPQIGDYEGLIFGIPKEFKQEAGLGAGSRLAFFGTETSYSRARGIPVDSSSDERRIFGLNELSYTLFGFRYAINESLTNSQSGMFAANRYRMYRRQGIETTIVSDDWDLVRQNKQGIAVRARFGGALDHSSAAVKITAGQA